MSPPRGRDVPCGPWSTDRVRNQARSLDVAVADVVEAYPRRVAVVDDSRRAEDAGHPARECAIYDRVQVAVEDENVSESLEQDHQARGTDEAVYPMPGAGLANEGRVVLDDHEGAPRQTVVSDTTLQDVEGGIRHEAGRSRHGLVKCDVERQEVHSRAFDDQTRRARAGWRKGSERSSERVTPAVRRRIQIVIARDERDALGRNCRLVKNLGQRLELVRRSYFGEIPGKHEVVGAGVSCFREGIYEFAPACPRVERTSEAQKAMVHRPTRPSPARPSVEHVHVRQVCNARPIGTHADFSLDLRSATGALLVGESQAKAAHRGRCRNVLASFGARITCARQTWGADGCENDERPPPEP